MRTFIFAGGFGTRIAELTELIPKPMIPIGKWPILVHIMSHYSKFGMRDFVILAGYKQGKIREFFDSPIGINLSSNNSWKIEVVDTGETTSTAGRLLAVREKLSDDFMLTYGDGLANIDISRLVSTHKALGLVGTVTAVRPPARFGTIEFDSGIVTSFREKDSQKTGWVNGGFFCFNKGILDYLTEPALSFESSSLEALASSRQLGVYPHEGFWHPMDTLRDMRNLNSIFTAGEASWDTAALG